MNLPPPQLPVLRHKPVLPYNGLTVILSHPGRNDLKGQLISGMSGSFFENAIKPFNRYGCDIRTQNSISAASPILPGTKCVMLLGSETLGIIGKSGQAVEVLRGSPFVIGGIVYLPSFHSQDALDRKNYEQSLNPLFGGQEADIESDSDTDTESDTKDRSKTSRKNFRFWLEQDIKKAVRICKEGLRPNTCNYRLEPNSDDLIQWMRGLRGQRVFFDIETTLDTKQITCFSLGVGPSEVWAVPLIRYDNTPAYNYPTQARIFGALASVFQHNTIVVHNSAFDLFILLWKYHIPPPPIGQIEDTMVMHHRLYAEVEKSLGHCVSLYSDQPYHKDEGVFHPHNSAQEKQLLLYNAKDVETLALVYDGLLERGRLLKALDSFKQANDSIRAYLTMSYRGIRLDTDALCKHIDNIRRRQDIIENKILPVLVGYPLNPRSPVQVSKYLYEQLGCDRPKDGELTGKKALYRIALKRNIPALKVIIALRSMGREASALGFTLWPDKVEHPNRVTCSYLVTGTDTYRLSSRAMLRVSRGQFQHPGYGTNLQNWNKARTRYLVIPDPGNVFVQVDQAGAEALIVAWISKPGRLRELFRVGIKPHTFVALHLFQDVWRKTFSSSDVSRLVTLDPAALKVDSAWKPLEKVIKDSDNNPPQTRYYYLAKQTCHSANYDIKGPTFIMGILDKSDGQIALPLKEGTRFLEVYRELFPEVPARNLLVRDTVARQKILYNRFGFPRTFTRPLQTDHDFKTCYAFDPQSTVGTITNLAATEIQAALDSHTYEGFSLLQNNHDSLLAQCVPELATSTGSILQRHLNRRMLNDDGEEFFMRSEVQIGVNWRDVKEPK